MTINTSLLLSSAIIGSSVISCNKNDKKNSEQPNIIFIITDDQGYGDIGFHGNPYIKTPVLDRLAKQSVRLSQFYACPVSAPTRACLMTGRYAYRTGVYDTYNGGAIMATEEITIAEALKQQGYKTGIIGKWHLGDNYPFRAQDQGFDECFVHGGGGIGQQGDAEENFSNPDSSYFNPVISRNGNPEKTKGYCTDVFTDEAIRFVQQNQKNPFFLYLAYNAPHTPLQVKGDDLARYDSVRLDTSIYPSGGYPLMMNENDYENAKRVYAMVSCIDDNIGRLWQTLRDLQIEENTIIIFMTDNGPQNYRYRGGLRGKKSTVFEGGIRVPFYIYWKGHLTENKEISEPAAAIDVLPTICAITSTPLPSSQKIDGTNLYPLITGKAEQLAERSLFFVWSRGFIEPYYNIAVLKGEWKIIGETPYYMGDTALQLYYLTTDPFEKNNQAQKYPAKVTRLRKEFDAWYSSIISSPPLLKGYCIIGTPHENPVILTRQDWHGARGKYWERPDGFGWWNVTIRRTASYSFELRFKEKISNKGKALVRLGSTQRSMLNNDTTSRAVYLPPFRINAGDYKLEAWYEAKGEIISPMYIHVTAIDE